MQDRVSAYERLSMDQLSLGNMSIHQVISALPDLCRDPSEVFLLFVETYGERLLAPLIAKMFGNLSTDVKQVAGQCDDIKEFAQE